MGFTDKKMIIKLLCFHNKFNEGLNEVIEDLLVTSQKISEVKNSSVDHESSTN